MFVCLFFLLFLCRVDSILFLFFCFLSVCLVLPFAVVDLSSIVKHTKGAVEDIRLRKRSVTERSAMDISEGMHLIVCLGMFFFVYSSLFI